MTVIKRNRQSTSQDLIQALEKLCPLLSDQSEDDAVADLNKAGEMLKSAKGDSEKEKEAIDLIVEAFEGEHELNAYTLHRESREWTEVEELANASSRVLSLARRMKRS